jgi:hypothetical protein
MLVGHYFHATVEEVKYLRKDTGEERTILKLTKIIPSQSEEFINKAVPDVNTDDELPF